MNLNLNYFYSLTPRQFYNIQKGFGKRSEDQLKDQLILNRRLAFTFVSPYLKDKNLTEEKWMPLYFEKQKTSKEYLEQQIELVEKQKAFWAKVDASKMGKA